MSLLTAHFQVCVAGVRKGRELGHEILREGGGRREEGGGRREMPASKPLFSLSCLLIKKTKQSKNNATLND